MEEKEEKFTINKEELKSETIKTAKKVKESVKEANIKEETLATKGFVKDMFKNPLEKIKEVAEDNTASFLKIALFLLLIWIIGVFIKSTYFTIYNWGLTGVFRSGLTVLKQICAPIVGILVYSIIILLLNKENKKSLTTTISTVIITKLPLIFASLVSLLTIISSKVSILTSAFTSLSSIIAVVFGYFGYKRLFGEKESKTFIKKYILIQVIYYVCYTVIGLLEIYI